MRFRLAVAFIAIIIPALSAPLSAQDKNPHVASTPPLTPEEQLKKFHLPPGFVIELVAAEPKINKPINIAFDAMGRLWVTGSVEYPYPAPKDRAGKDTVKILSDFAANGLAQTVTTFADNLNIPIGVLPNADCKSAIIYSIPNIYEMTDTKGTGKANERQILYGAYGFADTHGMTGEFVRGFDGWIYCCHGFSNTSKVQSHGDTAITMQSGNTYRIKPDGSKIEYFTHGQVNPFGLAFDPLGNLYSCDCHSRPVYQLLKGAYYPSFGKPHDGLGFGPELLTHDHGSTAISGIVYYAADQFPAEFRDNVFIGNVVTNRINRDRLEAHGSTYKGIEMPDFVKCDDPWFRPVDLKIGPDGAMYVADFYNRIIGHYEVPLDHPGRDREKGRIWRIWYKGTDGKEKLKPFQDLTKLNVAGLIAEMDNPNIAVRIQAMEQLVAQGGQVVEQGVREAVGKGTSLQKAHGLWVLERIGKGSTRQLASACKDPDRLVRVHAMRILTDRGSWGSVLDSTLEIAVTAGLGDKDAFVKRNAVAALGSHPDRMHLAMLLKYYPTLAKEDTHLQHVFRMALRDILRSPEINQNLGVKPFGAEMDDTNLAHARAIAEACLGVHDSNSARFLQRYLEKVDESFPNVLKECHYIVRYGEDDSAAWVLKWMQKKYPNIANQGQLLKTVQQANQERGGQLSMRELALAESLTLQILKSGQTPLGVELAGMFKLRSAQDPLLMVVNNPKANNKIRNGAVTALIAIDAKGNVTTLADLINSQSEAIEVREQIATSLAATNLPDAQAALLKALETAPARLQTTIATGLAGSPAGGEKLLQAVTAGKASARLLQETPIAVRLRQAKIANLGDRVAKLTKGLPSADQRVQELLAKKRDSYAKAPGDSAVGFKVFEKHCAACHVIANKGSKIGPQLDGIGVRGIERILEDILDPSRNVDQAFRTTTLVLNSGQLVNGLLLRQDGTVLVLADSAGKEVRVPAADVQERLISPLSPMPGNFAELIPQDDFNHLLAYLLAQRTKD